MKQETKIFLTAQVDHVNDKNKRVIFSPGTIGTILHCNGDDVSGRGGVWYIVDLEKNGFLYSVSVNSQDMRPTLRTFEVVTRVTVVDERFADFQAGEKDISTDELKDYCNKAVYADIDTESGYSIGDAEMQFVSSVQIDWETIKEVE